jgi:small subunit ribosomal protein S20
MAITKNAKKAHRASQKKRIYNIRRKVALHDEVKTYRTLITQGKKEEAATYLPTVYKAIDKACKRGVIKPNTASRKKSRLTALLAVK